MVATSPMRLCETSATYLLLPVICGLREHHEVTKRVRDLRLLVLVGVMAVALAPGALAREPRSRVHDGVVVVLALPGSMAKQATPDTQRLALELADRLRAAAFRVVVAGAPTALPLEELVATSTASSADLTLGVRSLGQSKKCAAAMTPEPVPRPVQSEGPIDKAELAALVIQLAASSRAEESTKLAIILASVAKWCPSRPTEVERYVLKEAMSPTLLLSLSSSDAGELLPHVPDVLEKWFAMERK